MVKTRLRRKGKHPISIHSRASKRASSPSIDTDKSLKEVKPPQENNHYRPSILAVYQGAGVSKKSKNGRKAMLSARAKRRQEKGMDRAEAVVDKQEKSIERSKERARIVQGRARAWDELNKKMLAQNANEEVQVMLALGENWADKENDADAIEEIDVEESVVPSIEAWNILDATKPTPIPATPAAGDKEEEL